MTDKIKNYHHIYLYFLNKSTTFASLLKKSIRDVVQLVVYLVWDQGVARSSRVIPTRSDRDNSPSLFLSSITATLCIVWPTTI